MQHLQSEHLAEIISIFKAVGDKTFFCQQCKRESDYIFNPIFLAYDTNRRTCTECENKVEEAAKVQVVADKCQALETFKEQQAGKVDMMLKRAGVPVIFQKASVLDLGQNKAKAMSSRTSYYIKGDVGVGKSHMAVALMRAYLTGIVPEYDDQKKEYYIEGLENDEVDLPLFIEVPELLLRIRDTYSTGSNESEKDIVEYYTRTPYLVLDDLGSEKASEFSTLMLYLIINRRCTQDKITVITSNLDLEEIRDRLSDRISSRIKGMCCVVNVSGIDQRYKSKRQRTQELIRQHGAWLDIDSMIATTHSEAQEL